MKVIISTDNNFALSGHPAYILMLYLISFSDPFMHALLDFNKKKSPKFALTTDI